MNQSMNSSFYNQKEFMDIRLVREHADWVLPKEKPTDYIKSFLKYIRRKDKVVKSNASKLHLQGDKN